MADDPVTRQFERHARHLQSWSGTPIAAQIAACSALENLILTSQAQETYFRALRLRALWHLGCFLLLARRGKGRPKKCSGGTISRPTYRELGITKPHIARDALAVAQAVSEPMLCRFLTTEPNLRVAALLRFARHHEGTTEGYWLLPPEWQDGLRARYGEYVDCFPIRARRAMTPSPSHGLRCRHSTPARRSWCTHHLSQGIMTKGKALLMLCANASPRRRLVLDRYCW
jgi:hypothetical protein